MTKHAIRLSATLAGLTVGLTTTFGSAPVMAATPTHPATHTVAKAAYKETALTSNVITPVPYGHVGGPAYESVGIRFANGKFFGTSQTPTGAIGDCFDYLKGVPTGNGSVVSHQSEFAGAVYHQAVYIESVWGNSHSMTIATATYAAINILENKPDFMKAYSTIYRPAMPAAMLAQVSLELTRAQQLAGPYTFDELVTDPGLQGQAGSVTFAVLSASGNRVPNLLIRTGLKGGTGPASIRSDANGNAVVGFTRTGNAGVTFKPSSITLVNSNIAVVTQPTTPNSQRLITSKKKYQGAKGVASYKNSLGFVCGTVCDGTGTVTANVCNGTTYSVRYDLADNGVLAQSVTLASHKCGVASFASADGHVVTMTYYYMAAGAWSAGILVGTLNVICVPNVTPTVTVICGCGTTLTGTVSNANTTRYYHLLSIVVGSNAPILLDVAPAATLTSQSLSWGNGVTLQVTSTSWLGDPNAGGTQVGKTTVYTDNPGFTVS